MPTAFLGVGSNIEPLVNVPRALALIEKLARVSATSRFYITEPIGRPEQEPYANGVWRIECGFDPVELKRRLRGVESALGRERGADKYAPRTIDLDLLLYGELATEGGELSLPSPDILKRPFVWEPLLEIEPALRLPGYDRPLRELVPRVELVADQALTRKIERSIQP